MSSERFQETYESIYNAGSNLLKYLRDRVMADRLSNGGDDATLKGLQSIENDIEYALNALQEQKYQVAVIAPMKAGKSTFLNALIGADILASETAACTVCRTGIRHIQSGQPQLWEHREGQQKGQKIAEGEAQTIVKKFLERTREIREKANPDRVTHFELWHPIQAISKYSSLTGFSLVDTPGPNEWQSAGFSATALKETTLEAVRTCDAIIFLLDYTSFKDEASSDLFKELIESRREFLAENTGKIYFVLNKVDMKSEKDRPIPEVIAGIEKDLRAFGFPDPVVYPVSARKGLLAKLILQGTETQSQKKDFRKFFSSAYAVEDEEGGSYTPPNAQIAPQALQDSGIPHIEEKAIQTIIQSSGWNLLSAVCGKLDKAAKGIEDTLDVEIRGWQIAIDELQAKVKDYKRRSESARGKLQYVRNSVKKKEWELTDSFGRELDEFSERAKLRIGEQFRRFAEARRKKSLLSDPFGVVKQSIDSFLQNLFPFVFDSSKSGSDPYKIQVYNQSEAKKIWKAINDFCGPLIKEWWIEAQDQLVRDGARIQKELALQIQSQTQEISNELSKYLRESLQIKLNPNPIQFPSFELPSIDEQIKRQQEAYTRYKDVQKYKDETRYEQDKRWVEGGFCQSGYYEDYQKPYTVQVAYTERVGTTAHRDLYEIDLRETTKIIQGTIDKQATASRKTLDRVVAKQVMAHFNNAEQQIDKYIDKFQADFEYLLSERQRKEAQAEKIRQTLELQKQYLKSDLEGLKKIRESLDTWKPTQAPK
ncbi:MAG: dynamin family protein [Oscillatoria sp. SIO1A7]|nr:dynamin family protein [Oscillatoria sp. SIO1A7]